MKFATTTRALSQLVAACKTAVSSRTTKDVLKCVRLTASDGASPALSATATDMELHLTVRAVLSNAPARTGSVLVNHERLKAILAAAPETELTLALVGDLMTVLGKGVRYELPTFKLDEFPDPYGEGENTATATIPGSALLALLRRTAFASDPSHTGAKGALAGVLLVLTRDTLTAVGSDSKRCTVATAPVTDGPETAREVCLPRKAVTALHESLPDTGEPVRVTFGNQFGLECPRLTFVCASLHLGRHPDYAALISREHKAAPTVASVDPAELLALAKRALPVGTEDSSRLELTISPAGLTGSARSTAGLADLECPLVSLDGPDASFAVDPLYLKEFAASVLADGRTAPIGMRYKKDRPLVFDAGEDFRHLLAPMVNPA